jgi:hypothetical protein
LLLQALSHLKSAVAAARILQELPPVDSGLLIRGNSSTSVDASLIADSLGLPLVGRVPELRGVASGTELGRLLELGRRKPVNRFAADVLELDGKGQ